MQKTRLGISIELLSAAIYFMGICGGYLTVVVLVLYALLFEQNAWLKRSAVKAVSLMVLFSLLVMCINLLPNAISLIDNIVSVFGGIFSIGILNKIVTIIISGIDIAEKVLFIALGCRALKQETVVIQMIDRLISKYMG